MADPWGKEFGMTGTMQPLTQRKAWKALGTHYKAIRGLHLRDLFAKDPKRGERMMAEAAGLYLGLLEEPRHRRDPQAAAPTRRGIRPARPNRRHVQRRENQRHRKPRGAARGPARAEGRLHPGGRRECRARGARRARQDGGLLRTACAAANGRATPASPSATSSTSASAAPTSVR